ncbi:MAG: hemolysin III family protein [Bacteroidota bacterium]|nr:hemolysin III family protein [Bacteroidota bacterium]
MDAKVKPKYYPPLEEKLNVISHGFGLLLSIAALILLVVRASLYGNVWHIVSYSVYGVSLVILYAASTFFHSAKDINLRYRLNVFDHSSIYVLIAGTHTPLALVALHGAIGWIVFGIIWGLAIAGVILKFFFIGKYRILSTVMYVLMGWTIIIAIKPLINSLSLNGLLWLFAGGLWYTLGAVLYSFNKMKFNHSIFHVFVLLGSISHFICIYFYVLPK